MLGAFRRHRAAQASRMARVNRALQHAIHGFAEFPGTCGDCKEELAGPGSVPNSTCQACGLRIRLFGKSWTDDDGLTGCDASPSPEYAPHIPGEVTSV